MAPAVRDAGGSTEAPGGSAETPTRIGGAFGIATAARAPTVGAPTTPTRPLAGDSTAAARRREDTGRQSLYPCPVGDLDGGSVRRVPSVIAIATASSTTPATKGASASLHSSMPSGTVVEAASCSSATKGSAGAIER